MIFTFISCISAFGKINLTFYLKAFPISKSVFRGSHIKPTFSKSISNYKKHFNRISRQIQKQLLGLKSFFCLFKSLDKWTLNLCF